LLTETGTELWNGLDWTVLGWAGLSRYDTERISVEQYTELMTNITDEIALVHRATGAKVLWVDTTPVPTGPECVKYFHRETAT
jgi:hypothetical protein